MASSSSGVVSGSGPPLQLGSAVESLCRPTVVGDFEAPQKRFGGSDIGGFCGIGNEALGNQDLRMGNEEGGIANWKMRIGECELEIGCGKKRLQLGVRGFRNLDMGAGH